ncbi:hypothetical protein Nepgr_023674 [Nepenthes gracilis]|uniref:Uncharacterized protein n=1 Tax=Nepenthes gracilis TaxID=150966 RepID=A0AAD3T4N8_NEPGR|nr:hypothetical protein Nepgr_023674 [Nepenthes gracilis]
MNRAQGPRRRAQLFYSDSPWETEYHEVALPISHASLAGKTLDRTADRAGTEFSTKIRDELSDGKESKDREQKRTHKF